MTNKLEDLRKQRDQLTAEIEALESVKPWKPETRDNYWVAIGDNTGCLSWLDNGTDNHYYSSGLIAPTEAEATLLRDRLYDRVRRQRLADQAWAASGQTIDWDDESQNKYHVVYDNRIGKFMAFSRKRSLVMDCIDFPTKESAIASVEGMEKPL